MKKSGRQCEPPGEPHDAHRSLDDRCSRLVDAPALPISRSYSEQSVKDVRSGRPALKHFTKTFGEFLRRTYLRRSQEFAALEPPVLPRRHCLTTSAKIDLGLNSPTQSIIGTRIIRTDKAYAHGIIRTRDSVLSRLSLDVHRIAALRSPGRDTLDGQYRSRLSARSGGF